MLAKETESLNISKTFMCNGITDFPSAQGLLLEGEHAVCMSSSPRNPNGIENEQLRLINVNSTCYRHTMDMDTSFHKVDVPSTGSSTTNGQSHYPEELQLTVYDPGSTLRWPMAHSQEAMDEGGSQVLLEGELADCMSDCAGSTSSDKRNLRGCTNTSRVPGMHADGLRGQEEPIDLPA
ncbi:hypothetical protein EV401DRAFT_1892864 [Pisolithus croceorrhizus]|nr:hypothetical protein EV401DRAFT_1892864 [Pisolithus croceorrhizus]